MKQKLGKNLGKVFLLSLVLVIQACSTVPLIGRKQVSLLPESNMVEMSLTNYSQFLKENKLSSSKEQTDIVKRVGARMSVAVEKYLNENGFKDRIADFKWEFNLVENNVPNAWCMPGGKVVFYTGILPLTQNDAGVAVVMGHEIAHAVARHGNERMSQQMLVQFGGIALSEAIKTKPEQTQAIWQTAYGLGTQVGVMLPYSRQHEYEGDKLGLIFMAIAGYDPKEAIGFWERMAANSSGKMPEFLSTHPVEQNRIEAIRQFLPEAAKYNTAK
ncbi:MAG: M48 family metallopeptidase [Bacteroidota bacterium]|nr:peptidase M48 [Odoribacter sp.]MDP3642398.1 M48 family metallopeptidase [Bacteroidota bacterium]